VFVFVGLGVLRFICGGGFGDDFVVDVGDVVY